LAGRCSVFSWQCCAVSFLGWSERFKISYRTLTQHFICPHLTILDSGRTGITIRYLTLQNEFEIIKPLKPVMLQGQGARWHALAPSRVRR
jgi:hypothetical protein